MKVTALTEALAKATVTRDGKRILTFAKALQLAGQFQVPPGRIGRLCDAGGIKIRRCKLGCF